MGDRGDVLDHADFKSCGLKSADGRLTALTGTLDVDFNSLHAVINSGLRGSFGGGLSGEGSALSGALEAKSAGRCPRNCVTGKVSDGNDGVVKAGADMGRTLFYILFLATLAGDRSLLSLNFSNLA